MALRTTKLAKGAGHWAFLRYIFETVHPKYPEIENEIVKNIICNRYHFANNDALIKVIKPIVDAIGWLESSDSTLANVFKELIYIHRQISQLEVPIIGFKAHALVIISKCAREKMSEEQIIRASLKLAKAWNFTKRDTGLLHKELINYNNNNPPFDKALSILSIVPYEASCERLFSSLRLVKSKIRNKLTSNNLSILGQLRNELKKAAPTKTRNRNRPIVEPSTLNDENVDIFFDNENELLEELNEELKKVVMEMNEVSVLIEFFDLEEFERYQETLGLDQSDQQVEDEWSIDDILNQ
ncbi:344_t:CDS:2, partial [Cetraspora pellucida]